MNFRSLLSICRLARNDFDTFVFFFLFIIIAIHSDLEFKCIVNRSKDYQNGKKMAASKLYNNATVKLSDDAAEESTFKVSCPKLGSGELLHNTNSHFCKLQNIVDYKWQDVPCVNWLTVHRSLPLIAYVINPSYMKSMVRNTAPDSTGQLVRILNYDTRILGLCKRPFSATIADLAFSYNSASRKQILIATVDMCGEISVFAFDEQPQEVNGRMQYEIQCLLVIHGAVCNRTSRALSLTWCPFVGFDDEESANLDEGDPGLKLAVASDETVELFSIDLLHASKQTHERSEIGEKNAYLQFETGSSVIRISLSNDATAVCCVSEDNCVNFLQMNTRRSDFELVHNWTPQLPFGDKIAHFHFLDDFNKLLEDSSYHFWGFAFIGSRNGELSIWDLKQWSAIQRVQIDVSEFQHDPSIPFRYQVDVSSHLITAVYGKDAFVVQLTFDESNESPRPRIEKITRFQLYNRLLSFVGKRNTPAQELDLFWMTKKSLERCVIDAKQLADESEPVAGTLLMPEIRKSSDELSSGNDSVKETMRNKLLNEISIGNKSTPSNVSIALSSLFHNSTSVAPSGIVSAVQHSFGNTSLNGSSVAAPTTATTHHVPPPPTILSDPKQFFVASNLIESAASAPPAASPITLLTKSNAKSSSSPTSEEVQSLLLNGVETQTEGANGESNEDEWNGSLSKKDIYDLNQKISSAFEQMMQETRGRNEELVQDLAVQQHLNVIENKLLSEIGQLKSTMYSEIVQTRDEIQSIKRDVKDPSNFKVNTKVLDNFLRKMMDQLNVSLCKGMSELVAQVRTETEEIVDKLVKLNVQQATQLETMQQNQARLESKFKEMSEKCNDMLMQQKKFLSQMQQINLTVLPSPSPSPMPMRGNHVLDPNSLFQTDRQLEQQIQRADTVNLIWKQIRSNNGQAILNGFTAALDLKDEHLLTQILKQFSHNPQALISHIKKDQIVLVSFLNQLTVHSLDKHPWKVKFISETVPLLDIRSSLVQSMLALFIDKLIHKIRDLEKSDGEEHLLCTLLLTILDSYRKQLKP